MTGSENSCIQPLENPGAPGEPVSGGVDYALNLNLAFVRCSLRLSDYDQFHFFFQTSSLTFTINGATFTPPTVPVLLQILSGAQTADSLLPSGSVYSLPSNSTIGEKYPEICQYSFHIDHINRAFNS